jgi:hypothetical protein
MKIDGRIADLARAKTIISQPIVYLKHIKRKSRVSDPTPCGYGGNREWGVERIGNPQGQPRICNPPLQVRKFAINLAVTPCSYNLIDLCCCDDHTLPLQPSHRADIDTDIPINRVGLIHLQFVMATTKMMITSY